MTVVTRASWTRILDSCIIICVMLAGFTYLKSAQPDDGGRVVLCTGIIANVANVARDYPEVIRICKEVGVDRADYPTTTGE